MAMREHVYRTNYRLLAGAWLAAFIVLAFSFHVCGMKGTKSLTVATLVPYFLNSDCIESGDCSNSLIRGCGVNAFCAAVVAWPLQAVSVVALAFVRRGPESKILN